LAQAPPVGRIEGRVPPHDLEAESSVLGAILLDPAAITRILEIIDPEDFYRENNAQIYRAALTLFREGEPIDNVTLAAQLEQMGVLERVGGRAHLAMLQEQTPTAANVEHYARIVKAKAYKRRLITAGTQVTALGYDETLEAGEAVNQAQSHVYAISDEQVGSGMERLYDLLKPAMDRIDAQMASGGGVLGIATGFHDLDRLTNGFKPADMVVIAGRPSMGKALALDTPIPTPDGWKTMGSLRVGDHVFDEQGNPCTVTFATPVMLGRPCFEVVFSDGAVLVADAEHQWATLDRGTRKSGGSSLAVRTTEELLATLDTPDGRANHAVPVCGALSYPERELPLDPYVLGVWLGDGTSTMATITVSDVDAEILDGIRAAGIEPRLVNQSSDRTPSYRLCAGPRSGQRNGAKLSWTEVEEIRAVVAAGEPQHSVAARRGVAAATVCMAVSGRTWRSEQPESVQEKLRGLGVLHDKHVPRAYLEGSPSQRVALLQGLMDTDGHADRLGHVEFSSSEPRLADAVAELATSLGIVVFRSCGRATFKGEEAGPRYRVRFKTDLPVFRMARKLDRLRKIGAGKPSPARRIVDVRPVASVPVRCIQVDSPAHLYLAGQSCIPTHNTSFVLNVALNAAVEQHQPIAIYSLEMSKEQLVERMLCEHARIDAQRLHRGLLSEAEHERLVYALGPLGDAPIYIDDAPMLDDLTLRLKARQARSREGIEMIIIDYLQLMHGRQQGNDSNRVQEVSAISRSLKSIARELRVPIIAISQLSRAPEQRPDKRPILSDLRESGSIEQDSDLVMFLYRDEYYNREKSEKPGIAEIIVAKHRNGPTGTVELLFRKELTRFENLDRRRPEAGGPED
jgi:replicative DNA helicase